MTCISLLLIVLSIGLVTPSPSQDYLKELLFGEVKNGLLEFGSIEILDRVCNYRLMPLIEDWPFYFKGDVWCPAWTYIKGESLLTRSRTRVVNNAVADFVKKAVAQGLITQEDAQPSLEA